MYTLDPLIGSISPHIAANKDDLPDPTSPTTAIKLPASITIEKSLSVAGSEGVTTSRSVATESFS
jgi:hypothetical protein